MGRYRPVPLGIAIALPALIVDLHFVPTRATHSAPVNIRPPHLCIRHVKRDGQLSRCQRIA
jgi:hypothetical protein